MTSSLLLDHQPLLSFLFDPVKLNFHLTDHRKKFSFQLIIYLLDAAGLGRLAIWAYLLRQLRLQGYLFFAVKAAFWFVLLVGAQLRLRCLNWRRLRDLETWWVVNACYLMFYGMLALRNRLLAVNRRWHFLHLSPADRVWLAWRSQVWVLGN